MLRRGALAANEESGRLERSIASRLVRLSIPAEADRQINPFSGSPDVMLLRSRTMSILRSDVPGPKLRGRAMPRSGLH
jgi:hypothetical protein